MAAAPVRPRAATVAGQLTWNPPTIPTDKADALATLRTTLDDLDRLRADEDAVAEFRGRQHAAREKADAS
jgi:hypothetical protein